MSTDPMPACAWRFRPSPVDGGRTGGDQAAMNFEHDLEVFVREVLQNSLDARRPDRMPVRVVFDLERLAGARKQTFLSKAAWPELRAHIDAAKQLAPSFRESLARLDDPRTPLSVLAIHDGPALGLSGPERGSGRFAMFARNKLLSDKESGDAGGSFGLGKSVLWAFSGISTIFVNSRPADPRDIDGKERFLGIAQLPWHNTAGSEWDGPGWFGAHSSTDNSSWSASVAADPARLDALRLARQPELDSGTSIVVPDFLAEGESHEIASALERAAAKWFWPAMTGDTKWLEVEIRSDGERRRVDPRQLPELRPFLHLAGLEPNSAWSARSVRGDQALRIPGVRDAMHDDKKFTFHDAREVDAAIQLDAVMLEDDWGELTKSMALVRGARMVVRYVKLASDAPVFALASAGTARGQSADDMLVEQFLRHAEPPSHDDWSPHAPKLHDRYKRGYITELKGLKKRLADAALILLRRRDGARAQQAIPAALRKVMAVPGGSGQGDGSREGRLDYRITDCRLLASGDDPGWQFFGWVRDTRGGTWILEAEGWLDSDGGKIPLPVKGLSVDGIFARTVGDGLLITGDGRLGFTGFCPIGGFGHLADRAVFGLQLRRRPAPQDPTREPRSEVVA